MSNFDQLTQDSSVGVTQDPKPAPTEGLLSDISEVENRIPKALSGNKRAIVQKLIALYKTGDR